MHKGEYYVSAAMSDVPPSERMARKKKFQEQNRIERPNPMRPKIVEDYLHEVLSKSGGDNGSQARIIKSMYKNRIDNRILNNLRQNMNEMIEDERGIIEVADFTRMWFTFFKGESHAKIIYEMLLPTVTIVLSNDEILEGLSGAKALKADPSAQTMVSVIKLSQFIDTFNYYPVRVNKIHYKNDSPELTYVMSSNTRSSLADKEVKNKFHGNKETMYLQDLLQLSSYKLYERFGTLREAFRYLDTDHSQALSLNEFA